MSLVVVDYGVGNIGSILNMLKYIGCQDAEFSANADVISQATKLILPGVGAYDAGMQQLIDSKLIPTLGEQILQKKKPILGICLGMQLLLESSEEGVLPGLGWVPGICKKFDAKKNMIKVPHMGWNLVRADDEHKLFHHLDQEARFYFVHSYYACVDKEYVAGTTNYGSSFVSAVKRDNIYGVQFHPEKSHKYGMQLLKNFLEL